MTVDLEAAHVILVLSDGIAAFALPNDPDRQTLVWVDDFTPDEAVTYLDGRGCMLPAHDKTNAPGLSRGAFVGKSEQRHFGR